VRLPGRSANAFAPRRLAPRCLSARATSWAVWIAAPAPDQTPPGDD
jgi:hypothetical protein